MFPEQKILIFISKGSCDTEKWRNDAENSALHHRNKLHFKLVDRLDCSQVFLVSH